MGWALYSEYMKRHTDNPITVAPSPELKNIHVYTGYGYLAQLSYYFKNKIEIGGRYSFVNPSTAISSIETRTNEYALGVTKYLYKHKVKLQSNLIYQQKENFAPITGPKDRWFLHFQVELGI
jgi:phosphate-selective porin OprO/OprP